MPPTENLIEAARQALPAVVQILAEGHDGSDTYSLLNPRYSLPASWAASGFFVTVKGETGYLLTNSHAVTNATKIKIRSLLTSEELFTAEIVGNVTRGDPDIALLKLADGEKLRFAKVSQRELPSLELGDSQVLKRGMQVKAIGYPYGMPEPNISGGEISNFLAGDEESSERLVTDAAINPGNSGGPSITADGKVVGINTSIIEEANNIGFITPINFFKILLPSLLNNAAADLTCLGAHFQSNCRAMAAYFKQSDPQGMIVTRLIPGGMLEKAGLERGDVLLAVNECQIDQYGNVATSRKNRKVNVLDISRELPLGEPVELIFFRKGKEHSVITQTLPRPTFGVQFQPVIPDRRYLLIGGMLLQELSYEIGNALSMTLGENYWREIEASKYTARPFLAITDIDSDSQADDLYLELGEIITRVNDDPFSGGLNELSSLLAAFKAKGEKKILIEFRSGSYGCFSFDQGFEDLSVKSSRLD